MVIFLYMISDKISQTLKGVIETLGYPETDFSVELTTDLSFGDYASNIALVLAKQVGKAPLVVAEEIKNHLQSVDWPEIKAVEVAGPGFLNFFLKEQWLVNNLRQIIELGDDYGKHGEFKSQKIIIEYTNTNVLKPFHIGHLLGNIIGESLSRLWQCGGASVKRITYQGDTGLHIAKAVWGLKKSGGSKDKLSIEDRAEYLGQCYALGSNAYDSDDKSKEEIKEINRHLFNKDDQSLLLLYQWGRQVSLDSFENLYKKLGTKFDAYFFESEVAEPAVEIVREYLTKGVFEESDGAVIFNGAKHDSSLHTRVFLTSQGLPTYEAKDIAHALRKNSFADFDRSVIVTAAEQKGYFKVVLEALRQIDENTAKRTEHLSHGMLRLPSGKMSSRSGEVITADQLLNIVTEEIETKMEQGDLSEVKTIAEVIAVGAIKYSILKQDITKDMIFDLETSISREGNSGPYLQYMAVRVNSVIEKAGGLPGGFERLDEISNLEKLLARFPEVVRRSGKENAPQYLCTYLFTLAGQFSSYYSKNKIIGSETEAYRLFLTKAVGQVLVNGLYLLGIGSPDRM